MKRRYTIFFAVSLLLSSCFLPSSFHAGGVESEKLRQTKNSAEAEELFNSFPVDKQIDVYLFGLKYIEPDDNSTKKFLVKDGSKRLPTILRRIRSSDSEFDKAYLMEVVSLINKDCGCVTDEEKAELSEIGSSINDRYHRNRFNRAFDELKK